MSKKQKARIQDLDARLTDAVTMLVVMRGDMRELERELGMKSEYAAYLENENDKLIEEIGECQAGRQALESQGKQSRAELVRDVCHWQWMYKCVELTNGSLIQERDDLRAQLDDLVPAAVWKATAKQNAAEADELRGENAELKEKIGSEINTIAMWEQSSADWRGKYMKLTREKSKIYDVKTERNIITRDLHKAQKEIKELRAQLDTINDCTVDFVTAFQPLVGTLVEYGERDNERAAKGE